MDNIEKNEMNVMELKDQDLEQVSGGKYETRTIDGYVFTGHVSKYDLEVPEKYYITEDVRPYWYFGVCLDSWEETENLFFTKRKHKFSIMLFNGCSCMETREFYGDSVTIYKECHKIN